MHKYYDETSIAKLDATCYIMQQSKPVGKLEPQLSVPHLRFPEHCESVSQSPSPMPHWFVVVQQLQPPLGTLHPVSNNILNYRFIILINQSFQLEYLIVYWRYLHRDGVTKEDVFELAILVSLPW